MSDADAIVLAAANGMTTRDIATTHGLTETEVQAIIDQEAARFMEGGNIRRQWLLESRRLHELGMKFFVKAMRDDGDPNSAMIFIRASERLSALAGWNYPVGYSVELVQRDPPAQPTSLDRIERALARVRGELPSPE